MKYKLLKALPDIEAGTIIEYKDDKYFFSERWVEVHAEFNDIFHRIFHRDTKDWYEEVKEEPRSIYDLKKGDEYFRIFDNWDICKLLISNSNPYRLNAFLTEREAKRNRLIRDLSTRTDKWLPKKWETFYDFRGDEWMYNWLDSLWMYYNLWLIFRNKEEYNEYMTNQAKELLFNV